MIYTNHSALKHTMAKKDAKLRLIRCVLLLQKYIVGIKDKKDTENLVAYHLPRLERPDDGEKKQLCIYDKFLDEQLLAISNKKDTPCFTDLVNYLVARVIPPELSYQ